MRARAARLSQRRQCPPRPHTRILLLLLTPHTPRHSLHPHNDNDNDAQMAAPEYAANLKFIKLSIPFPHVLHVELAR